MRRKSIERRIVDCTNSQDRYRHSLKEIVYAPSNHRNKIAIRSLTDGR